MAKLEAQRKWRENNDYKSLPSYRMEKERSKQRWKKLYHTNLKFKKSELARQKEYYWKNRDKILIKRKMKK